MKKIFVFLVFCVFLNAFDKTALLNDINSTCPVRFVDVAKQPKFACFLIYKDGDKIALSSVKAMFHYFYTQNYNHGLLKQMLVSDYKSGELIDATSAFYVFGSRIVSASGDDLIPFATLEDAKEFMKANSGHKIFEQKDISKKLIDYLN